MTSLIFPSKNVEASGTLVEASRFRVEFLIAISLNQLTFQKFLHTTAAPLSSSNDKHPKPVPRNFAFPLP